MDGVEEEGDDQREEEGRPASDEKVSDGGVINLLETDHQKLLSLSVYFDRNYLGHEDH